MHEDDASFDLEAVVRPGRPALMIQDGDFTGPLPAEWEHLDAKRPLLKALIPSVGRLEIAETNRSCGTAFVAGLGVLMTNKHVIEEFATHDGGGDWSIKPGRTVRIDFREEHERTTPSELQVESVIGVHATYDLALLRFRTSLDHIVKILRLQATEPPPPLRDREVVVIGYPDRDLQTTEEQVKGVFQNILGVKRLQPGRITGPRQHDGDPVFGHDCSTIGGNSGSCVIDVETGHVLGLHFGGAGSVNLAVPLWKVSDEALLRDLNWVR